MAILFSIAERSRHPVIDYLLEKGLNMAPFLTTHAVKSHIMLGLKSALEHAKVKLLNHEVQKKELLAFEEKVSTNGSFSYSAPSGLHDDCVLPLYRGLWSTGYGVAGYQCNLHSHGDLWSLMLGCVFEDEWGRISDD